MSLVEPQGRKKPSTPMSPFVGFLMILVVGIIAYFLSGPVLKWVTTAEFNLGIAGSTILPIHFPADWPEVANRLVVALFLFFLVFAVAMVIWSATMSSKLTGEMDVELNTIRAEKEKLQKRRK